MILGRTRSATWFGFASLETPLPADLVKGRPGLPAKLKAGIICPRLFLTYKEVLLGCHARRRALRIPQVKSIFLRCPRFGAVESSSCAPRALSSSHLAGITCCNLRTPRSQLSPGEPEV
jgi:hypothetical protein